ncbi:hypothetical protein [Hyphobacterium sp.]|uniref:hypothetical protein n=1 Tax=Hyphobacterium sp. TaxID=2004662 RepID=UPI003BABD353
MAFSVDKSIIDPPGIFQAVLHGPNIFSVSLDNARTLVRRFETAPLNGVIIDYSDAILGHSMREFHEIASVFAKGLPKGMPFAYVFGAQQLAHVMYMTRLLHAGGLMVKAHASQEDANAWIFPLAEARRAERERAA